MLEFFGFMCLLAVFMLLVGKVIQNSIGFLALQSLSLSLLVFYLGFSGESVNWHLVLIGLLTLLIKVVALPWILYKLVNRVQAEREIPLSLGIVASVIVGILIIALTYSYVVPVLLEDVQGNGYLLPVALSTLLLGCFYMISRRSIISQLIGIIVIENSLFLSALAITGGMPIFIELGIFFDVLVGALVMGVMTYRISDHFETLDTQHLTKLRG